MIHAFHGFLGSPSDFDFLGPKVHKYDLYKVSAEEVIPQVKPEDILIGYSMGARFAMEVARALHFNIKKLIIINSHPGLDSSQKNERGLWEESVLERLKKSSPSEFLKYWNSLPLFKYDQPLTQLTEMKLRESVHLFEKMRLSQQTNYLPLLSENKNKVLWITGTQDEKYHTLAKNLIAPQGITWRSLEGGHRLLQKEHSLVELLKEEGIL